MRALAEPLRTSNPDPSPKQPRWKPLAALAAAVVSALAHPSIKSSVLFMPSSCPVLHPAFIIVFIDQICFRIAVKAK
jgi:hypothetical protein